MPHHVVVANWITMIAVEKMMFSSWLFIMYILVLAFMNWFFFCPMQNWTVSDLFHPQKANLGSVISVYLSAPHVEDCEIKIIWRKQQRKPGLCCFLSVFVGRMRCLCHLSVISIKRDDLEARNILHIHCQMTFFTSVKWIKCWFQCDFKTQTNN